MRRFVVCWIVCICVSFGLVFSTTENENVIHVLETVSKFRKVCYGDLGCFWSGPPFQHPYWRPISVPPQPPEEQNTIFYLFTRRHNNMPIILSPFQLEILVNPDFNAFSWTRILIPNTKESQSTWLMDTKDNFLTLNDENVIMVGYGNQKLMPNFLAAANARVVGAQVAQLIEYLCNHLGADEERFHVIGNGLGAHIAGYAGERLSRLGRITGLDPSGPYFRSVENEVKLETTDALYVDVISSNPGRNLIEGSGTIEDLGNVNFWPNGGRQFSCLVLAPISPILTELLPLESFKNTLPCQRMRATEFFALSIIPSECLFVGVECSSYDAFLQGNCNCGYSGERCRLMGQYSEPAEYETRYYLRLGEEKPYCLHQYQVIVHLEVNSEHKAYGTIDAVLNLKVKARNSFQEHLQISINLMEEWQTHKFLLAYKLPIGKPEIASASIQHLDHADCVSLEDIEINYLLPVQKSELSTTLCRDPKTKKFSGTQTLFTQEACTQSTPENFI